MFKLERTPYGVRSTNSGSSRPEDVALWLKQIMQLVAPLEGFSLLVDFRAAMPATPEATRFIELTMGWLREHGMGRSVAVFANRLTTLQIVRLSKKSGIYEWVRYLDGRDADWERKAIDWIERGIDPDALSA